MYVLNQRTVVNTATTGYAAGPATSTLGWRGGCSLPVGSYVAHVAGNRGLEREDFQGTYSQRMRFWKVFAFEGGPTVYSSFSDAILDVIK